MFENLKLFFKNKTVYSAFKKAEKGDVPSMVILADSYYYGESVNLDLAKAYEWYRKASENENAKALCMLGYMKRKGIACDVDPNGAFAAFKKSAELDYPMAMYNLGICHEDGIGTERSRDLAEKWYKAAEEKGYRE